MTGRKRWREGGAGRGEVRYTEREREEKKGARKKHRLVPRITPEIAKNLELTETASFPQGVLN